MLKHLAFLLPAMMFALPAQTAVLSPYQETGCTYEAGSEKTGFLQAKAYGVAGMGAVIPVHSKTANSTGKAFIPLPPAAKYFSSRSIPTVPNSAIWHCRARSNKAWHTAGSPPRKTAKPSFIMKCEHGMIKEVKLPKNK